jgi:hypothetical protein
VRAFCFALLSLILLVDQSAWAREGKVTGAEMLWYGIYTVGKTTVVKDPKSAAGTRLVSGGIVGPAVNSDRITVTENARFGFGYRLHGRPGNAVVPIVHVTIFPGKGIRNAAGQLQKTESINYNLAINQADLFVGRRMGSPVDETGGVYKIQVWHKGRILLEKQFTIHKP